MSSLPTRTDISGTPSNATAKSALSALFDFVAQRFAPGTSGAGTCTAAELLSARQGLGVNPPRSWLAGCTMSTAGSSTTMSIAAGEAVDSSNTFSMQLSAIAKTTSAWAVGTAAGGLDTGTIANNTWYHFYVIRRPDTGVVDVVFSLSASAPTLPTNYTQYRRIGSGRTNGSAQWTPFLQVGSYFLKLDPTADVNVVNLGTTTTLYTLNVPAIDGITAKLALLATCASACAVYVNSPAASDVGASAPYATLSPLAGGVNAMVQADIVTDSSGRIQAVSSAASTTFVVSTVGWTDLRGRDA